MRHRSAGVIGAVLLSLAWLLAPGSATPAWAAEYTLESQASYDVQPDERQIGVTVELAFTNTTPDTATAFSVFDELEVAIHDEAVEVSARDPEGPVTVGTAVTGGVNVATVELRDPLRFEDSVTIDLAYTLPDTDGSLRVRPSVVRFPAWSFGTSGSVSVAVPAGYEVRVDGDPLTAEGDLLVSGPIDDPTAWLALVTAVQPGELTTFEATVPLDGGTADVVVRSFADDEGWGERTLALMEEALPRIEETIGLPYPRVGQLILTETVTSDGSGFGEGADGGGTEILVSYDQPDFTALHQVAHVWLSPDLVESRWIREGWASFVAAGVAPELDVEVPYDPAQVAEDNADSAFPLDAWSPTADVAAETYGYAASWAVIEAIDEAVGDGVLETVLARTAASLGPYEPGEVAPDPDGEMATPPDSPLTSRSFLDQLENVSGEPVADIFAAEVLTDADVALIEPRAEARTALEALLVEADGWGAPDPVLAAMTAWSFDEAMTEMAAASDWLQERDRFLAELEAAGLQAPDRLQEAYRTSGGGPEAAAELSAERAVAEAYVAAAELVNAPRSFLSRIGLIGGDDPQAALAMANGRFADGDLRGAPEAIAEAERLTSAAELGGVVRLASLVLIVVLLVAIAVVLFRRRASYTAAP